MTLSNGEIVLLATPIGITVMASLMAWWSYGSIMRRRKAREASESGIVPSEERLPGVDAATGPHPRAMSGSV